MHLIINFCSIELIELREKVKDTLITSAINYYEAERACCEIVVPQQWEADRKKAYNEFICRCQDYQVVNESDNIDLAELNFVY